MRGQLCKVCSKQTSILFLNTCINCLGWEEDPRNAYRNVPCGDCGLEGPVNDDGICGHCYGRQKTDERNMHAQGLIRGFCTNCGVEKKSLDLLLCEDCVSYCASCDSPFYPRNRLQVLCLECENLADNDTCPSCKTRKVGRDNFPNFCTLCEPKEPKCPICAKTTVGYLGEVCSSCNGWNECICGNPKPTYEFICLSCKTRHERWMEIKTSGAAPKRKHRT